MKISFVFGTRPELIKLAPVIKAFNDSGKFEITNCFTGQHYEMVLPLIKFFDIHVDKNLSLMNHKGTMVDFVSTALSTLSNYFIIEKPDLIFVQGDTNTALAGAMAGFYNKIKIAHVEAGLRTNDMMSPYPEEFNRQIISKVATYHFASTPLAKDNLLAENISETDILVTGNTVIDALFQTLEKVGDDFYSGKSYIDIKKKMVLITGHRRENFGYGFEQICNAIYELAKAFPEVNFVYPVHLNPEVKKTVHRMLDNFDNIFLIAPLDYADFTKLMQLSYIILTDSGGIQEEAPSLGKPVIIMRDTTERPEAINAGAAILVGTSKEKIVRHATTLLTDTEIYTKMSSISNPFGDGNAAVRILNFFIIKSSD